MFGEFHRPYERFKIDFAGAQSNQRYLVVESFFFSLSSLFPLSHCIYIGIIYEVVLQKLRYTTENRQRKKLQTSIVCTTEVKI